MKKIIFFICCIFSFNLIAQQWNWAKNVSYYMTYPTGTRIATANNSNFYVSANFNYQGSCLIKYDTQGNELFRYYLPGCYINDVTWTANYVYVAGNFSGTILIAYDTLNSYGSQDAFIICFTPSGSVVWAKNYGGTQNDMAYSICSDTHGNVYLTGYYSRSAHFGTSTLTSQGMYNMFMAKFNSLGNVLLLKSAGTMDTTAYGSFGKKIKTDILGNIYITGQFSDLTVDTFHLVGYGSYYLCKLDSSGSAKWLKTTGDDYHPNSDLTLDALNNIIVTGNDAWNHGSNGRTFKYNSYGQLRWDSVIGCGYWGGWGLNRIASDGNNSFCVGIGSCSDDFSYYQGYFVLTKYDSSGVLILLDTVRTGNASNGDFGRGESIIRDSNGDFIVSGVMQGTLVLGTDTLSTPANQVFIAKFKGNTVNSVVQNFSHLNEKSIYPNPSSGKFFIRYEASVSGLIQVSILDTRSQIVYDEVPNNFHGSYNKEFDLSRFPKGIYFIEITLNGNKAIKKIILD